MIYKRITAEERLEIPKEHRCEVGYNGYHDWKQLDASTVLCLKCLEKRKIAIDNKEV